MISAAPLSSVDHNCMLLLPAYKTVLRREKIQTKEDKTDIDELTEVTCSYVTFCENRVIPTKMNKVYPNNKPWVSKEVKAHLQQKNLAWN